MEDKILNSFDSEKQKKHNDEEEIEEEFLEHCQKVEGLFTI